MKFFSVLASIALLILSVSSYAVGVEEGSIPVNVINETGKDIGTCLDGGGLVYAPQAYKGIAFFVPINDPAFAAAHKSLTRAEGKWLKEISGPSSQNRLYVDKAGNRVLVLWFCKQGDCGAYSAYATFNLATQEYGIELTEVVRHRSIGSIPPPSRAALACAGMIDRHLRDETEAKLFGKVKGTP